MKRIELLDFASKTFNDEYLTLPPPSDAPLEVYFAKTISTAFLLTQLLEVKDNSYDTSLCKFNNQEQTHYASILEKTSKIKSQDEKLTDHMLNRFRTQLSAWLEPWSSVKEEFSAKILFKRLLELFLNKQNILDPAFPNYLTSTVIPNNILECLFGMLRIELSIMTTYHSNIKESDLGLHLLLLLDVVQKNIYGNPKTFYTLKQLALGSTNNPWKGTFSEWSMSTPPLIKKLVEDNKTAVFNVELRNDFFNLTKKIPVQSPETDPLIQFLNLFIKQLPSKVKEFKSQEFKQKEIKKIEDGLRSLTEASIDQLKILMPPTPKENEFSDFIKKFLKHHPSSFAKWGEFNQPPMKSIELKPDHNAIIETKVETPQKSLPLPLPLPLPDNSKPLLTLPIATIQPTVSTPIDEKISDTKQVDISSIPSLGMAREKPEPEKKENETKSDAESKKNFTVPKTPTKTALAKRFSVFEQQPTPLPPPSQTKGPRTPSDKIKSLGRTIVIPGGPNLETQSLINTVGKIGIAGSRSSISGPTQASGTPSNSQTAKH